MDKRTTEADAVAELRDGMIIGIGGWGSRRKPMALVRALLRSDITDLTVIQNVELPMWLHPQRVARGEEDSRAKEALATVGLGDRLHESVRPLSGGDDAAWAKADVAEGSVLAFALIGFHLCFDESCLYLQHCPQNRGEPSGSCIAPSAARRECQEALIRSCGATSCSNTASRLTVKTDTSGSNG